MKLSQIKRGLMLATMVFAVCCYPNLAWASTVTYKGSSVLFDFDGGDGARSKADLFGNLKGLYPGDTKTQEISIKNDDPSGREIEVYLRAIPHDEKNPLSGAVKNKTTIKENTNFLHQFELTLKNENGHVLFSDKLDKTGSLTNPVLLGTIAKGKSIKMTAVLKVPKDLAREYQGRMGEVDWEFSVKKSNSRKSSNYNQSASVTRLWGATRYVTMAAIATEGFRASDRVILVSGDRFPDALSISALAGAWGCPVILTLPGSLSPEAKTEIERLGATDIVIFGGEDSVSAGVEAKVKTMGKHVERIAGADRAATSVLALRRLVADGLASDTVIIATGTTYADSLSVGPWSYAKKSPIVLFTGSALSEEALAAIREGGFTKALIVGGVASVPASVESQLEGLTITRLAGSDRYATSAKTAKWATTHGLGWSHPGFATGRGFADALAGAALCGRNSSPMLLADSIDAPTITLLHDNRSSVSDVYVLGGEAAVSADVISAIRSALN